MKKGAVSSKKSSSVQVRFLFSLEECPTFDLK